MGLRGRRRQRRRQARRRLGRDAGPTPVDHAGVNDGDVRYLQGNGDGTSTTTTYLRQRVHAQRRDADRRHRHGCGQPGRRRRRRRRRSWTSWPARSTARTRSSRFCCATTGRPFVVRDDREPAGRVCRPCSPIYYPATSTQNSPWGLALGDADGDGDLDLWVGDRALYVYLYLNNGAGSFTLVTPATPPFRDRPNVYLGHDTFRRGRRVHAVARVRRHQRRRQGRPRPGPALRHADPSRRRPRRRDPPRRQHRRLAHSARSAPRRHRHGGPRRHAGRREWRRRPRHRRRQLRGHR